MHDASALEIVILVGTGVAAGFINTLAGAGSLLTIPALMLLGMPADIANATNRVSVLATSISGAQETATLAYGRDIPHVMLLHVGGFQTVMLPKLLDLLERRGFQLVSLEEAQKDPAYAIDPDVALPYGATLLQQMVVARSLPARPPSDEALVRLAGLCR